MNRQLILPITVRLKSEFLVCEVWKSTRHRNSPPSLYKMFSRCRTPSGDWTWKYARFPKPFGSTSLQSVTFPLFLASYLETNIRLKIFEGTRLERSMFTNMPQAWSLELIRLINYLHTKALPITYYKNFDVWKNHFCTFFLKCITCWQ